MMMVLLAVAFTSLRAPIDPYVSGDTFRARCDYAYDEITPPFVPEEVAEGSTIFVNGDRMEEFFGEVHPRIGVHYVLISHNTDRSIPGVCGRFLEEEKILGWFTQNPDRVHPKLHGLPIGLENRHWNGRNWETLTEVAALGLPKRVLLYCNFAVATFPEERRLVYELFPFSYKATRKRYDLFAMDLALSQFVLSPRGNGLDTHRLWEALHVGAIPIVKSSSLDPLYEGLPVLVVQDWREVTRSFCIANMRRCRGAPIRWRN